MNSAQRRQARREFPHRVEVKARPDKRYIDHDIKVEDSRKWCRKKLKKNSWRSVENWDETVFYFANEKDATFFALKWL